MSLQLLGQDSSGLTTLFHILSMRVNEMYLLVWGPGDQTKNIMHTSQVLSVKSLYRHLALALVLSLF